MRVSVSMKKLLLTRDILVANLAQPLCKENGGPEGNR
jgi:hypothetical protein